MKTSPFAGRTHLSVYLPAEAPTSAVVDQLKSEINRTERSTSFQIKDVIVLMLNDLMITLIEKYPKNVPYPGVAVFSLPKKDGSVDITFLEPKHGKIDIFSYNLDEEFFLDEEYFP